MNKRNWKIVYTNYTGMERKAVELLSAEMGAHILRDQGVYTIHVLPCQQVETAVIDTNAVVIGLYNENALIHKYIKESDIPASVFQFYTYVFSGTCMAMLCLFYRNKETGNAPVMHMLRRIIGFIAIMAVCLFTNSYFKTLAATKLDSAQLYPLNQGAALILSMGMSAVFFREKITVKAVLGILLAFVGLLVMNVM